MKRREFLVGLAAAVASTGYVPYEAVAGSAASYRLGSANITLNLFESGGGKTTFFAPHEDESTAVEAAKDAVRKFGGRLFWLTHGGGRNIRFSLRDEKYVVDPNRIFSNKGAEASLTALGNYSDGALYEVRVFADAVLSKVFSKTGLIVGMHNNSEKNYSALSYLNGGELEHDAQKVSVVEGSDPDDFFFTTWSKIFSGLEKKGFNAVLQKRGIADDGSLSVRCQRSGLPYVNVEAQHGHEKKQEEMLRALLTL